MPPVRTASPFCRYLPDPQLAAGLVGQFAHISLYHAAAESYASEQGSRLVAMDGATRNTGLLVLESVMFSRHDLSDADWERIKDLLPGRPGQHGGVGNDNRLFVDAIRYLAKTGIAWADLPTYFGKPNSLWQWYNRWCQKGVWQKIAAALRDDDTEWLSVDSSCIRAAVAAAGAKKKLTVPAVKRPRRWAAAGAVSEPRFTLR